jgi:hypothetical protein
LRTTIFFAAIGLTLTFAACCPPSRADTWSAIAEIADKDMEELSGLVASRRHPGFYYTHNDSGDSARVFVLGPDGRKVTTLILDGAHHRDWEDIAIAPGEKPGTWDVVVADIGDNKDRHPSVRLYRFPEPESFAPGAATMTVKTVATEWRYPDGPTNAEALIVHPQTGVGYIITKRNEGLPQVYRLPVPWRTTEVNLMEKVGPLVGHPEGLGLLGSVTAADLSPDGRRLIVRNYVTAFERTLPADVPSADFEKIFAATPRAIEVPPAGQAESIAYTPEADAVLTGSEGKRSTLYRVPLKE